MTAIRYKKVGKTHTITLDGHATGSDTVCTAISSLVYALEGWLMDSPDTLAHQSYIEPGKVRITAEGGDRVETAFQVVLKGLNLIDHSYPGFMDIKEN